MGFELKQATTYKQQIKKLRSKGCFVADEVRCECCLRETNYYRLAAYFIPFRSADDHNRYVVGTNFDTVYRIYEFDKKLRGILFSAIEDVEIFLRSSIAYYHAHKYGPLGYLDAENFRENKHDATLFQRLVDDAIKRNRSTPFIKHHIEHYGGNIPVWAIVEILTFSNLSFFFSDMNASDQKTIARGCFGAHPTAVASWLRCCSDLRNICAHYGRLYNRIFSSAPKGIPLSDRESRRLWGALLALKLLYPNSDNWNNSVCVSLAVLFEEYGDVINLSHIAFPNDWEISIKR